MLYYYLYQTVFLKLVKYFMPKNEHFRHCNNNKYDEEV